MISPCQPLPRSTTGETRQVVVRAIRDRAGENHTQPEPDTNQMVREAPGASRAMGWNVLSRLVFGCFNLIFRNWLARLCGCWLKGESMSQIRPHPSIARRIHG
jgi:hypothetical protein